MLVAVGDHASYTRVEYPGVLEMKSSDLLPAVAQDVFFQGLLRGVALCECAVHVCASSADEVEAGLVLQGFETLGDLAARMPAAADGALPRYLYVRVRLLRPRAAAAPVRRE